LERHGWSNISITPIELVNGSGSNIAVHSQFKDPRNQMSYLSIVLCARKS
jgi:hypothetical protein